jgi:hypothetical protein
MARGPAGTWCPCRAICIAYMMLMAACWAMHIVMLGYAPELVVEDVPSGHLYGNQAQLHSANASIAG